jgi:hypothetical protein
VTVTTRRRVILAAFVVALALPAEAVLLQALSDPDPKLAIRSWVSSLDETTLAAVADSVQDYPLAYRKEILRALDPDRRARTWRKHIRRYIDEHPDLDSSAVVTLEAALVLASPSVFEQPTAEDRARVTAIAEQLVALIGREEAEKVLYRLGPRDGQFASREPLSMRLSNWVRGVAVAMADGTADCDCNIDFGCDGYTTVCAAGTGCEVDSSWPACGWFWMEDCNGRCRLASNGS